MWETVKESLFLDKKMRIVFICGYPKLVLFYVWS